MLHYCSYTHHFGENMKVQFILDNGDIIETTVIDLSRYLDSMAEAGLYAETSGTGFSNAVYDFVEEKQQKDENSLHARLRNIKHDDTK